MLGAGIAKYANQIEGGASQLNKVLRDLPTELAEEFSPSLTNPSGKALKDVDMYDFLDYFVRVTKHNNNSVSELAQSLQALREFERGGVNGIARNTNHSENIKILTNKEILDTIPKSKTESVKMQKDTLKEKTTSDLGKEELDKLPLATNAEFSDFLEKISRKDYKNTPKILKIATLNDTLKKVINKNHNANVFITRSRAWHISKERKDLYNQALRTDEQVKIPSIIKNANEVFVGGGSGFVVPFKDIKNADKINLVVLDSDNKGNFLITAKKINKIDFEKGEYQKASKDGS